MPLTRYARIEESPYLRRGLEHADPDAAAHLVGGRVHHLVHFGDPVAEYWALIDGVTLCDVAHERQVEIAGRDALAFTQMLVPRDLSSHEVGQCKYAFMTNADGGIICDPVILRVAEDRLWLSAAGADVHVWCQGLARSSGLDVAVTVPDVAPVRIQGPHASAVMVDLFGDDVLDLGYYRLRPMRHDGVDLVVSRTGWGGDVGFEVYVIDARTDHNARAERWWDAVMRAGERHEIMATAPNHVRRIESGMLAMRCDIDESTNPFEVPMGYDWMVDLDQPDDFVGKDALRQIRDEGPTRRLVGVDIDGPDPGISTDGCVPRPLAVEAGGTVVGRLTSACHSPRLQKNIGFAMVEIGHAELGTRFQIDHPAHGRLDAVAVPKPHAR